MNPAPTTPPADPASPGALAALSLPMLLSSLGTSTANVALPTLAVTFAASFSAVQWVLLAYLLANTSLLVSVGRLGDRVGRRRLLLAGIGLYAMASLLAGLAPSLELMIAARAAQGVGGAIMMALALALVGETVPRSNAGRAMGVLGTMSAVGTALGPSLGGALIAAAGWRSLFLAHVPLALLALALASRYLPDGGGESRRATNFDVAGTVLLTSTLTAYALALTLGRGAFGPLNLGILLVAVFGGGAFILAERRAESPLFRPGMLRDPALGAGLALSALVSTVMMTTLVVGPFYLSRTLGLDPVGVGMALSIGPLVAALTGVPAGRLADQFGAPRLTVVGLVAMGAGSLLLTTLPTTFGTAGYVLPLALLTAGYGLFQTANNTAVMLGGQPDQRGVFSGLLNLSRNLGLITGASLMGAVFAFAAGASDVAQARPENVGGGMRTTFGVATGLVGVALLVAARSLRRARNATGGVDAESPLRLVATGRRAGSPRFAGWGSTPGRGAESRAPRRVVPARGESG